MENCECCGKPSEMNVEVVRRCDRASHIQAGILMIGGLRVGAGIETFKLCLECGLETLEDNYSWSRIGK